ncbi:MAG: glutamyl-tRNA(Gln) amidotransferase subunit [Candidatus Parcubacteria bacterium]|jgi:aspartyl-tRNA(Asn)/glutamyl-tRNA(Gln) amidotransferase subunit A
MKPLNELTLIEARTALDAGEATSVAITDACLAAIRERDGALHAFLDVWETEAKKEAEAADIRRAAGKKLGVLDGIPLAIKDNLLVDGRKVTAASKVLEGYVATGDATVIAKLKAQGAVFLGRTNMDEFAMGGSTENSAYGPTHHPKDPERVPGGSSGGSAAAVAAHLCIAAIGSDTGGSIRQPAAFCGIVGLKPTYGRVSRSGLIAMASSLDQVGPMTKTAEDAAVLLEAIQGHDVLDQTTAKAESFAASSVANSDGSLKGLRIGLPKQAWDVPGLSSSVRERVSAAVETYRSLGAEIIDVELPYVDEALAVYYILMPCDVSANMSRFDGMRFGPRAAAGNLLETYLMTRGMYLGWEVRRRILLGTYALSKGYYDAYYRKAKKVQRLIQQAYATAFMQVDVLLTPTTPGTAFKIGEKINDPLAMYLEDVLTVGVNVAGLPAVSVPCGEDSAGLPIGMQLIGKAFDEATILRTAAAFAHAP